jgi:hypothetical protein
MGTLLDQRPGAGTGRPYVVERAQPFDDLQLRGDAFGPEPLPGQELPEPRRRDLVPGEDGERPPAGLLFRSDTVATRPHGRERRRRGTSDYSDFRYWTRSAISAEPSPRERRSL